jgi:membrane fusion protein (multidrug efflux system)
MYLISRFLFSRLPSSARKFLSSYLLLSLLLPGLLLTGCGDNAGNKSQRTASAHLVEVSEARMQDLSATRTLTGTLQAIREVNISNQVAGLLTELPVYPGDQVEADQTLARLDDRLLEAEVEKSAATLKQASVDLRRLQDLAPRKLASESDIAQAQTVKNIAESELKLKQTELDYTHITAPFSGVVSQRLVEPGDVLPMHTHILSLLDTTRLKAEISLSELLLPLIDEGNKVVIKIDALGEQTFNGRITRIYPAIDKNTRRGTIEIMLDPAPKGARAGQLCRVTIKTRSRERLMIPYDAVRFDKQGSFVYVVDNARVKQHKVTTGIQLGQQIEIIDGLAAQQRIVSKGFFGLKDGMAIREAGSASQTEGGEKR